MPPGQAPPSGAQPFRLSLGGGESLGRSYCPLTANPSPLPAGGSACLSLQWAKQSALPQRGAAAPGAAAGPPLVPALAQKGPRAVGVQIRARCRGDGRASAVGARWGSGLRGAAPRRQAPVPARPGPGAAAIAYRGRAAPGGAPRGHTGSWVPAGRVGRPHSAARCLDRWPLQSPRPGRGPRC